MFLLMIMVSFFLACQLEKCCDNICRRYNNKRDGEDSDVEDSDVEDSEVEDSDVEDSDVEDSEVEDSEVEDSDASDTVYDTTCHIVKNKSPDTHDFRSLPHREYIDELKYRFENNKLY